jgi:hypothetical protein
MTKRFFVVLMFVLIFTRAASADTVILRDGASYSGQFTSASGGQIAFTDGQGVEYRFPVGDVVLRLKS